ncbi:transporter [Echinococcus multilocularis]|uniref:Transporter n=1 Tax=Echinococcus multilocularis TaxID=6211 RepID=A0A0S4MPZ0_ECHMU|nr:transporter [Echinococcus multilocularis]
MRVQYKRKDLDHLKRLCVLRFSILHSFLTNPAYYGVESWGLTKPTPELSLLGANQHFFNPPWQIIVSTLLMLLGITFEPNSTLVLSPTMVHSDPIPTGKFLFQRQDFL